MQFFKVATLLALGVSAIPVEERSTEWAVSNFVGEHIPHSVDAETSFKIVGEGFDTKCDYSHKSKSSNGLVQFGNKPCKDDSVTFSLEALHNVEKSWVLSVTHEGVTKYIATSTSFFETKGDFKWEKLDLPKDFELKKTVH